LTNVWLVEKHEKNIINVIFVKVDLFNFFPHKYHLITWVKYKSKKNLNTLVNLFICYKCSLEKILMNIINVLDFIKNMYTTF